MHMAENGFCKRVTGAMAAEGRSEIKRSNCRINTDGGLSQLRANPLALRLAAGL